MHGAPWWCARLRRRCRYAAALTDRSRSRTALRPWAFSSAARESPSPARTARHWIVRRARAGRSGRRQDRSWTSIKGLQGAEPNASAVKCKTTTGREHRRVGKSVFLRRAHHRTVVVGALRFAHPTKPLLQNGLTEK